MRYYIKKHDNGYWEMWENASGVYAATTAISGGGNPERFICYITADDILDLFNETVPCVVEEPYMEGNPDCKHAWRPWKFNKEFIQCSICPAMKKVKRLVPLEYKHG